MKLVGYCDKDYDLK